MNLYDMDNTAEEQTEMSLEELQAHESELKVLMNKRELSQKLFANPDFQELVVEDYFQKEPIRLAMLMTSGRINPKTFDDCVEDLRSIGHLQTFLRNQIESGNIAADELEAVKEAREEFLLSEANE